MATRLLRICGSRTSSSFSVCRENSSSLVGSNLTLPLRSYVTNGPGSYEGYGDKPAYRSNFRRESRSFEETQTLIDPKLVPELPTRSSTGSRSGRRDEEEHRPEPMDVMLDRPSSLAYFNKVVPFMELITALDLCIKKYTKHSPLYKKKVLAEELKSNQDRYIPWCSLDVMSKKIGVNLTQTQHNSLIARLDQLAGDSPEDLLKLPKDLQTYLEGFSRTGVLAHEEIKVKTLDSLGRAYAAGRRKTATARVWLIKGEGEIFINTKPLASFFQRIVDREQVILPLELTSTLEKYNAWILVLGGGHTGKSGAIRLGIAKALVIHEPELRPILDEAGLLTRDPRMVERKKTGKPKARKSFTWVKR